MDKKIEPTTCSEFFKYYFLIIIHRQYSTTLHMQLWSIWVAPTAWRGWWFVLWSMSFLLSYHNYPDHPCLPCRRTPYRTGSYCWSSRLSIRKIVSQWRVPTNRQSRATCALFSSYSPRIRRKWHMLRILGSVWWSIWRYSMCQYTNWKCGRTSQKSARKLCRR